MIFFSSFQKHVYRSQETVPGQYNKEHWTAAYKQLVKLSGNHMDVAYLLCMTIQVSLDVKT